MANQTINREPYIGRGRRRTFNAASSLSNICAVLVCFALAGLTYADPPLPVIANQIFVVTNSIYGAVGDGLTNNAAAIQSAINDASTNGGGIVEIPADGTLSTYLSGPINLASGVNLQIDSGAMLQMLPRNVTTNGLTIIPNWPSASTPFISGSTLTDVAITGLGTIDGQGTNWWVPKASTRPNFVQFTHSTRILIQGVTLQNPPTFHIMAKNSNVSMTIQNITINTPSTSPNTDGMDLASTNILIRNCFISDGDDNIEIGGSSAAAADITISNCTFGTGHGLSIGSSVNGAGSGVQGLIVSNCVFNGTEYGIHIKTDRGIGGLVQNLQYLDLTMTNVNFAIAIYCYYNEIGAPSSSIKVSPFMASTDTVQAVNSTTPILQNITVRNVTASSIGANIAGIIWGLPESLVSNVTLSGVNFLAPIKTFCMYHAQGVQIIDSNLSAPNSTTNTLTLYDAQFTITNTVATTNLVTLGGLAVPLTNNVLTFINALAAVTDTNMLGTGPFTLDRSTLTLTQDSVIFSNSLIVVSASALGMTSGSNVFSGALSGPGPLTFLLGDSQLSLQGDVSGYSGNATVLSGTLLIDNTTGIGTGAITVASTGTLGGSGVISGPVTVNGTLAPADSPGTLTISNNLVINSGAVLQYELGTNSDLTMVSGDLGLDGTLNIIDAGGLTNGTYPLFTYGGTLTTNGSPTVLTLGAVASPSFFSYAVDISSVGAVRLLVTFAAPVAGFNASPTNGLLPLTVTFTDASSGSVTNWFWDFGDGVTTNIAATSVMHTYSVPGSDTVQLIVSGQGGVSTNTVINYITAVCVYTLSSTNASFSDTAGGGTVTVTTPNGCPWTAVSNDGWIQITGGSVNATGDAAVAYGVLPNGNGSQRVGTMTIAGQTITVTQAGDTTAPTVVLTAPTSGIVSGNVAVSATAVDDIAIARVEFYRDANVLLGTVVTPPYSVSFNATTVNSGSHCFFAKAYDPAGNVGSSGTNCVFVSTNILSAASAQTMTIRVVAYNIMDDIDGFTTPLAGLIAPSSGTGTFTSSSSGTVTNGGVLEGIGEEIVVGDPAQPLDILALEETTSNPITVQPIVDGLNAFYSVSNPGASNMYAMSTYQATESDGFLADGNGPNAMVYNTKTVQLLASVPVDPPCGTNCLGAVSGEYREVMRYEFAPAGGTPTAANEFYIYVSHYKSGVGATNIADRAGEAVVIRYDEATNLPADARVIYVGDFNITTSGEAAYQTILSNSAPNGAAQGQSFDPLNLSDNTNIDWGASTIDPAILGAETESATDLRYRDDLQVMTSNVLFGVAGGLAYVPGTYHAFGNNGTTPYFGSVISGSDTALNNNLQTNAPISAAQLYQDLSTASDHLPIVADYTLPVSIAPPVASFTVSPTSGAAPLTVTFSDTSSGSITNRFWNFGDGGTINIATNSVLYTYNAIGVYSVMEIVSGPGGSSTNTQVNIITATCGYTLSATNASFGDTGGSNLVTVSTANTCPWIASGNNSWIQIVGGSVNATGNAAVAYGVLPNGSAIPRVGTMTIAGQTFTVTQAGDTTAPTVVLTAPTSGIVSGNVTVSATAMDDIAVVKVEFYRDTNVLLGTVTTAPDSVNFDTTTVGDGSHCFFAKAYDLASNVTVSSSNCVTVDSHAPSVVLELTATTIATNQINLSWSVSSDHGGSGVASYRVFRDGEQIGTTAGTTYSDIGLAAKTVYCYAVAAQDELGHVSAHSADACAQTFITPVPPLGRYNGLAIQTNAPSQASSGSIMLLVSKDGPFAASLTMGGVRTAFKGQFDVSGNATNIVARNGLHSLQVILHLDLVDDTDQITGTVSDGVFTSEVLADRDVFNAMARCPLAGSYTVVLQPPERSDPSIPEGFGYGTLMITPTGLGRMIGFLADGTKITVSVPLSKHGTWPLYQVLYKNRGACIGWVSVGTNSSLGATVDWFRPPLPTSPFFPAGFTTNVTLFGEKYVSPADGGPSVAGTNIVTLGGGNLVGSIVATVLVSDVGSVTVLPPNDENLQMKLQTTSGQLGGSFTHPVLNKTINFNALVLQLDGTGSGYFLGTNASGFVVVEPIP
jgi:polygalacturonase